jgi:cyclic pyranopterin phosphate synthase
VTANLLEDRYRRKLNYLRVSVTDRCNLRCIYCVPQEAVPLLAHSDILRYEEILRVVRVAASLGVDKIRITGGEPLVRRGLMPFLQQLQTISGIREVTLTTNAVLVGPFLEELRAAGIRRLNISLDTLRRERFARLTGRDCFEQVWRNIQRAADLGFSPLKINVVAMQGINDDELTAIAALTRVQAVSNPLHRVHAHGKSPPGSRSVYLQRGCPPPGREPWARSGPLTGVRTTARPNGFG